MATDPAFAATINHGFARTNSTADTSTTAPTHTSTVFTAGANGSKLDHIRIVQLVTASAAGVVNVFMVNSATYYLWETYSYTTLTVSNTAGAIVQDFYYDDVVLKNGDTIQVTNTIASNGGTTADTFIVHAFGGDL